MHFMSILVFNVHLKALQSINETDGDIGVKIISSSLKVLMEICTTCYLLLLIFYILLSTFYFLILLVNFVQNKR